MSRAGGRKHELRGRVLERLRAHHPLTSLLELIVDDAYDVIVPQSRNLRWKQSETGPDVTVGVSVATGSSQRENARERKFMTVQATVEARYTVAEQLADHGFGLVPWYDRVNDEISALLTSHDDGWVAEGESGGTTEPLPDSNAERYTTAQRFDYMRFD